MELRTITRREPRPEAEHYAKDDAELFECHERPTDFWRADFCHVQRRQHAATVNVRPQANDLITAVH